MIIYRRKYYFNFLANIYALLFRAADLLTLRSVDQRQRPKTLKSRSNNGIPTYGGLTKSSVMNSENDFSKGYERGLNEARPVIELEHRVKAIGSRAKLLSWAGARGGTIAALILIAKLPIFKNFFGRKADEKEFLKWKEEKRRAEVADELLEKNAAGGITSEFINERKVRRHAREFIMDRYDPE